MDEIFGGADQRRDPDRRWLRHTFQEGPGFGFLAPRGGGRPEHGGAANWLAIVRQRARIVRVAREDGIAAALALGECSRTSLWRWQYAYAHGGLAAVAPAPGGRSGRGSGRPAAGAKPPARASGVGSTHTRTAVWRRWRPRHMVHGT